MHIMTLNGIKLEDGYVFHHEHKNFVSYLEGYFDEVLKLNNSYMFGVTSLLFVRCYKLFNNVLLGLEPFMYKTSFQFDRHVYM